MAPSVAVSRATKQCLWSVFQSYSVVSEKQTKTRQMNRSDFALALADLHRRGAVLELSDADVALLWDAALTHDGVVVVPGPKGRIDRSSTPCITWLAFYDFISDYALIDPSRSAPFDEAVDEHDARVRQKPDHHRDSCGRGEESTGRSRSVLCELEPRGLGMLPFPTPHRGPLSELENGQMMHNATAGDAVGCAKLFGSPPPGVQTISDHRRPPLHQRQLSSLNLQRASSESKSLSSSYQHSARPGSFNAFEKQSHTDPSSSSRRLLKPRDPVTTGTPCKSSPPPRARSPGASTNPRKNMLAVRCEDVKTNRCGFARHGSSSPSRGTMSGASKAQCGAPDNSRCAAVAAVDSISSSVGLLSPQRPHTAEPEVILTQSSSSVSCPVRKPPPPTKRGGRRAPTSLTPRSRPSSSRNPSPSLTAEGHHFTARTDGKPARIFASPPTTRLPPRVLPGAPPPSSSSTTAVITL